MNRNIINRVKYNKVLYKTYYYLGSFALKILRLFVKQDDKLIVFSCFGGRKYDDSPRCIFEAMLKDERFSNYNKVWAFNNPNQFEIDGASKIKTDTFAFYKKLLASRVWISNSSMERALSFKRDDIFYLNTWHGTAIKLMGSDIDQANIKFKGKGKSGIDIMMAQGQYDVDIFSRVFGIPKENFRVCGLPRNDDLINSNDPSIVDVLKKKLGLPVGKKIILYAPTFREFANDNGNVILTLPVNLNKWQKELGSEYLLLMRAHYEVTKMMKIEDNEFVRNVSDYPNLNELMIVSDLLISDYSSIFFDYSIQDKPMLCFAYDYDEYSSKRGMYFDIREALNSNNENEGQLIDNIKKIDWIKCVEITRRFRNKYIESYGYASVLSCDIIWNEIKKNA